MKKPKWVIEKEQSKRASAAETVWLFGLHAVRDALLNPRRERLRLVVTLNAQSKLEDAIAAVDIELDESEIAALEAPYQPHAVKGMGPAQPRSWRRGRG